SGGVVPAFTALADARGCGAAVLGGSASGVELFRSLGLRALYHGDEAVADTAAFSLEGRGIRKVRQSVHRLEAAGFRARVLPAVDVGPELRDELERIARARRGAATERGFVMALDALFGRADAESVF